MPRDFIDVVLVDIQRRAYELGSRCDDLDHDSPLELFENLTKIAGELEQLLGFMRDSKQLVREFYESR